jgi:glutamyl/glutaminyl-tRNA synthetase
VSDGNQRTNEYRGRLAPSPTGYLHLGHAKTFWTAQQRAQEHDGTLVLRNENLDTKRCQPKFISAMFEDLAWFGFQWQEGPDVGGPFGPYSQSQRLKLYRDALAQLQQGGWVYPCNCSRQDVLRAAQAPHQGEDEPIYPGTCRPGLAKTTFTTAAGQDLKTKLQTNWRFQVPDGELVSFTDQHYGPQAYVAGTDFGDFVVWRHDDVPAYHLAVVVDDAGMRITEVVRGADLLRSTARQLLLYRALGWAPPDFFHCDLVTDTQGVRLAKRNEAHSLQALRAEGADPAKLRASWRH